MLVDVLLVELEVVVNRPNCGSVDNVKRELQTDHVKPSVMPFQRIREGLAVPELRRKVRERTGEKRVPHR